MTLRRPHYLVFEPRERPVDSLRRLLAADEAPGMGDAAVEWIALAPHLGHEVVVESDDLAVFQALAPGEEVATETLAARFGAARISRLVETGLLLDERAAHGGPRQRDARLRDARWWGPAALGQVFGRWDGVDVAATEREEGRRSARQLVDAHGPPPPEVLELGAADARIALPAAARTPLGALLQARLTCRNFDADAALSLAGVSAVLQRVFGALATLELAPGATVLKKTSPSGGGLHPIEAFVLAQRVEGLAPGLYHYHCLAHALEPMGTLSPPAAAAAAHELVAGQPWFATAPVLVLMAARFPRSHWKYPHHAKAWKVVQLDAGHLSQTLYLSATEGGLGAFVTAAINDGCAERLFGLDGLDIAPVAVSGFGPRATGRPVREFDPPQVPPR
jgi:putative peptide maturation dehydrogenase